MSSIRFGLTGLNRASYEFGFIMSNQIHVGLGLTMVKLSLEKSNQI